MSTAVYGLLAEFDTADELVAAASAARQAGYAQLEAYSPYPIDEMEHILPPERIRVPQLMFAGGVLGALGGWALQYYCAVVVYPINIGGRPLNSWPVFMPVIFEMTVLTAAVMGVLAMIVLNGLPLLYHPVFNVPRFAAASRDKFFLCIPASDSQFDREATSQLLERFAPGRVAEVPP